MVPIFIYVVWMEFVLEIQLCQWQILLYVFRFKFAYQKKDIATMFLLFSFSQRLLLEKVSCRTGVSVGFFCTSD